MSNAWPAYRSHKTVRAAQVLTVADDQRSAVVALPGDKDAAPTETVAVDPKMFARGVPKAGDYLVSYDDGYLSWSPRAAFEGGYTRLEEKGDPRKDARPVPTIGRIVHFRLSAACAEAINRRRKHARDHMPEHVRASTGVQLHVGNEAREGDTLPMLIVAVHGKTPDSCVNGQVFLDGNDTLWATSVSAGEGPGTFSWPGRV